MTDTASLALAHGQSLVLDDGPLPQGFRIMSSEGQVTLSVVMTAAGPVLQFKGGGLAIQAEGDLAVAARNITLHGQDSVSITTGGDINVRAEGDMYSEARIQTITADLGNIYMKANDDVRLNGERVLVNC